MAIIRKNELTQMDEKTMDGKLRELKMELVKINAQRSMGTMPENPGKIKEIKKTIARIETLKTSREVKKKA